ncbi:MAG: HNH endonuclease signature motif containing protein [Bacteroidota bacterium]|jgi:5-methylcytosine-specific restriction endonuclease McrA
MTKDIVLIERLLELQRQYGLYRFKCALKDLNRRRLEIDGREKRKRFPWSKYQALYRSQKGICRVCRELMPLLRGEVEIDHRDPNRQEGFNDDDNLQLTHRKCNRKKSSRSVYQQAKKSSRNIVELLGGS